MFNGETAPQHLHKHLPELLGGQVIKERIEDGAEVEEGISNGVKCDIASEVGSSPGGLGNSGHHDAANLVGKPAHHQRCYDEN